jgi:hypothetical protein
LAGQEAGRQSKAVAQRSQSDEIGFSYFILGVPEIGAHLGSGPMIQIFNDEHEFLENLPPSCQRDGQLRHFTIHGKKAE